MMTSEKHYRVYRQPRRVRGDGSIQWNGEGPDGPGGPRRSPGAPRRVLRFLRRALFVVLAAGLVWALVAFVSFRHAVKPRNDALPANARAALTPADGPAIASSHVILLVGADSSKHRQRSEGWTRYGQSDSLMLMRVDVPSRTVAMLSIPRDLQVDIPGHGSSKINAAYSQGGLSLTIRTVRTLTGVPINHVVQIDLDGFKEMIDGIGGIDVDNPRAVVSNEPFDGVMWKFPKGRLHLDGRHARAYARLRHAVDPREGDDRARALRQQRVIDAVVSKIVSRRSLLHPTGVPTAVVKPLATDISASQMLAFAFGKFWASSSNTLHCRLSGDASWVDGEQVLISNEENAAVVRMFLGRQAPLPPRNDVGAGCVKQ